MDADRCLPACFTVAKVAPQEDAPFSRAWPIAIAAIRARRALWILAGFCARTISLRSSGARPQLARLPGLR